MFLLQIALIRPKIFHFSLQTQRWHELDQKADLNVKSHINRGSWHVIKSNKEIKPKKRQVIVYIWWAYHFLNEGYLIRGGQKGQEHGSLI